MLGWLKRLVGWPDAAAAPRPARGTATAADRAEPVEAAPPAGFGMRRPLVGRGGGVAGFELLLPESAERRLRERPDPAAAAAHHITLLAAAAKLAQAGRPALVRMAAPVLERPAVASAVPTGTWVMVDGLASLPAALLQELRGRGVMLGVPDGPPAREPRVDFVAQQAQEGGLDTLLLSSQRWRELSPRLPMVALGLRHLDDVERALRGGYNLAGGQLARSGQVLPPKPLGSAAHRICELLNHLAMDRDTAVIAEAVRADVALTYRMLRYANSPAIGLKRSVESVDQAVNILGRAELYRWLSVLLMSAAGERQASRALQEDALARGRLLEAVARTRGDADIGAHFTLGLLSMIEVLLQVPMASAVAPLRLGEAAGAALLQRQGPWADRLALLDAVEAGDAGQVELLAAGLGVADDLPALQEAAWRWAAAVSEGAGAGRTG